jgi:hypothetical protein
MIEERKAHRDARRLGRPHDLEEIVVAEGDLEVDVEEPVELGRGRRRPEMAAGDLERQVRRGHGLEIRMEQPVAVLADVELARVEALGVGQTGALDIAARLAPQVGRLRRETADQGLEEPVPQPGGDQVIAGEDTIAPIALVAAEDLVAAISREEDSHPGLPRETGAEIRGEGRVVAERLIVGRHQLRERLQGLVGRDDLGVVRGIEVARGQLRVVQLVVPRFLEADGEGLHPLARDAAHEAHDRAAVGAAAQEGAGLLGLDPAEGLPHRFLGLAVHGLRGGRLSRPAFAIGDIPVAMDDRVAVFPDEEVPRGQPTDVSVHALRRRDRAEVQVGVDGLRIDGRGARQGQRAADAGAEGDAVLGHRVVEAPEAEAISGQDEPPPSARPERDGEGPAQPRDEIVSVLAVEPPQAERRRHAARRCLELIPVRQVEVCDQGAVDRAVPRHTRPDAGEHAPEQIDRPRMIGDRYSRQERAGETGLDRAEMIAVDDAPQDGGAGGGGASVVHVIGRPHAAALR